MTAAPLPLNMPQTLPVGITAMWHACSAASSSLAVGSTTNASLHLHIAHRAFQLRALHTLQSHTINPLYSELLFVTDHGSLVWRLWRGKSSGRNGLVTGSFSTSKTRSGTRHSR